MYTQKSADCRQLAAAPSLTRNAHSHNPIHALKKLAILGACAFSAAFASGIAVAADFPVRPLRLVVAFPPGGGVDVAARLIGAQLGKQLGQAVIIDNVTGAAGNIGAEKVVRAPADGHTLLFASIALAINPTLYPKLTFDPQKDLTPISIVSTSPFILMVNKDSPIRSFGDFLKAGREASQPIQYASAGSGSGSHLFMELLVKSAGLKMSHVPYRGAAPAMTDVVGGQVPVVFDSVMTSMPYIESGKVRALAITSGKRSAAAPAYPTIKESGVPDYEATSWFAIFSPAGTPPEILQKLNGEIVRAVKDPVISAQLRKIGADPIGSTPAEAEKFYKNEVVKWRAVVRSANVEIN